MKKNKIKILSIILAVALIGCVFAAQATDLFSLKDSPVLLINDTYTLPGDEISVSVSLTNMEKFKDENISGIQFNLNYDTSILTPISAECPLLGFEGDFEVKDGYIMCLLNDTTLTGVTTNGEIATFKFKTSENASIGSYTLLSPELTDICTNKSKSITKSFETKNGKVRFGKTTITQIRLGGTSRVDTSLVISNEGWESAESVIITNGYSFADALAGGPLSYALDAPILLTANSEVLENSVLEQIKALGAKNVIILGGTFAVNQNIENQLIAEGFAVERLAGTSRMETAVEIAEKLYTVYGQYPENAFISYGYNYPDALAVSAVAAVSKTPILFAYADGKLDQSTIDYLSNSGISKATILGGTLAVGENCEVALNDMNISNNRIFGTSRYDTAFAIVSAYDNLFSGIDIALATGNSFPDALAGGAFAAKKEIPVILVHPTFTAEGLLDYIKTKDPQNVYIFGGIGAVSDETVDRHTYF